MFGLITMAYSFVRSYMRKTKNIAGPDRELKKEEVITRNNKLDPNNNKNRPENKIVKRRGKRVRDDGFEHRTSDETALLP
jgi:hypothetical protein